MRVTCGHGSLLGGCLLPTSCCSTTRREGSNQGQSEQLLLPAEAALLPEREENRRYSGYKTTLL